MKYIIKESQAKNYIRRVLDKELFFDYVKEVCSDIIGSSEDEDEFIFDVVNGAITDFLYDEGFIDEALSGEIAREFGESIFQDEYTDILEYILQFYEKYGNVDDNDESLEDLMEK